MLKAVFVATRLWKMLWKLGDADREGPEVLGRGTARGIVSHTQDVEKQVVTRLFGPSVQQIVRREKKSREKRICTGLQQECYEKVHVLFDVRCSL